MYGDFLSSVRIVISAQLLSISARGRLELKKILNILISGEIFAYTINKLYRRISSHIEENLK